MDDDWGYHHFKNPPYHLSVVVCSSRMGLGLDTERQLHRGSEVDLQQGLAGAPNMQVGSSGLWETLGKQFCFLELHLQPAQLLL